MVHIAGWGHTPFGKLTALSLEDLIKESGTEALAHAGVDAKDVDSIWLGHFNSGMSDYSFASSLALSIDPALRFRPSTRLENACATGSAAVYAARNSILAGETKIALVVGVEKMRHLTTDQVTHALALASYQAEEAGLSFPQIFARFAQAYFQRFGDASEALAMIAAKNHANAEKNPLAQLRRHVTQEFCATVSESNPMIAPPLKMTDCSLISDGAAALVLVADDVVTSMPRAVKMRAAEQVNDYLPVSKRDTVAFEGPHEAIRRAKLAAGVENSDLDLAEVHDCFTIAELMIYEAMGLAEPGRGIDVLKDGTVYPGGALPVNLSGGLKAKGHPIGATGVSMHVMVSRQLTGEADEMQVPGAQTGMVFNMGGSGVVNYCSVLEAVKA